MGSDNLRDLLEGQVQWCSNRSTVTLSASFEAIDVGTRLPCITIVASSEIWFLIKYLDAKSLSRRDTMHYKITHFVY